jgi:hypothetical protein
MRVSKFPKNRAYKGEARLGLGGNAEAGGRGVGLRREAAVGLQFKFMED